MKHLLWFFALLSVACSSLGMPPSASAAPNNALVKGSGSSVYYLKDGNRYVFPYEQVFFSWFSDFSSVTTLTDAEIASYPLKRNITYKPGIWMVKIISDPKVYAVGAYSTLHWVTDETIARQLYGAQWNQHVRDVPDAFFENYVFGDPITHASQYNPIQRASGATIQASVVWDIHTQSPTPLPAPATSPTPTLPPTPTPTPTPIPGPTPTPAPTPAVAPGVTACLPGTGTDYQVGPNPGQLASLDQVPWERLQAGDTVRIFYRSTPYRGKFLLTADGTQAAPVRICGVKGPNGERPVVHGENATTRGSLVYGSAYAGPIHEARSVVTIKGNADTWDDAPSYIQLDGLAIRGAHPSYQFKDRTGATQTYSEFGACIWIERGHNITIADNEISDCSQGIFSKSTDDGDFAVTKNIRIAGNHIHGNGIVGSDRLHNTYTQSVGIVYEFNQIGPGRSGSGGNAIKDRSVGTVIRFNRINEGAHAIDLVESEDFPTIATANPAYRTTFVYGNQIQKDGSTGSFFHYGGDHVGSSQSTWGEPIFRKGTLYFWNNTVYVTGNAGALFQLSTTQEKAEVWNNIFYFAPSVTYPSLRANQEVGSGYTPGGILHLGINWINANWADSDPWHQIPGQVDGASNLITGTTAPINLTTFIPATTAVVNKAQTNLAAVNAHPVSYQLHGSYVPRIVIGAASDLGAYEQGGESGTTPTPSPSPSPAPEPIPSPSPTPSPTPTPTPSSGSSITFANFPNGTNVNSTANGWGGTEQFEVVNGLLQAIAGRGAYGEYSYQKSIPGANQGIEIVRRGGTFVGNIQTLLHAGYNGNFSSGRYIATWSAASIDLRSENGVINYNIPINVDWNQDTALKMTIADGVVKLFVNGAQVYTYTDPHPLSGGFPGFSLVPGSNVSKQQLVSVKLNP
jgi:hypothetical protein